MRILVTGGAGYIGTELVHKLLQNKELKIIIYDNLSRNNYNLFMEGKLDSKRLDFIHGDILDSRKIRKVLDGIDIVIHLAAKVTIPYSNQDLHHYEQVNHWGTSELVYHIEKFPNITKLIYLSSASVYGLGEKRIANENTEPIPNSHYGLTKLRGEEEVKLLSETDIKTQIIRCANVFGYSRSMRFDSIITRFMFDARFNERIKVYGDGGQVRPFISINNLVDKLNKIVLTEDNILIKNLFEFNLSINDIIHEGILKVYPEIEILFVSQDLPLKSLELESIYSGKRIEKNYDKFRSYLQDFNKKFTF